MAEKVTVPTRGQVARDVCGGVALVSGISAVALVVTWAVLGFVPFVVRPDILLAMLAIVTYGCGFGFFVGGGFDG